MVKIDCVGETWVRVRYYRIQFEKNEGFIEVNLEEDRSGFDKIRRNQTRVRKYIRKLGQVGISWDKLG